LAESIYGHLAASEDARELVDRMPCLQRNPEGRRLMGRATRNTVEESYSTGATTNRLMDTHDEILAARRA
jgi:glycosyltransferase involved in cell wall biosynthesis